MLPEWRQSFPNSLIAQIQALRLVALSLTLSRGREDGAAVGIKGSARKQVVQAVFYFSDDLQSTAANLSCFLNCLKPQNPLQPAPSPVGEGWGEGIPRIAAIFPNTFTAPIQALRLVALFLALSHGREDGVAVGIKASVRKTGFAGCFLFFRRPAINGCKPKLLLKLLETAKLAATCSLPCGGGLGRGHSPNCGNLSQTP